METNMRKSILEMAREHTDVKSAEGACSSGINLILYMARRSASLAWKG